MILPLCRKKLGFDSYKKCTLSFGELAVDVCVFGDGVDIVAVRQTEPYAAQASDKYPTSAAVVRKTV
jgi:hypothetical protein